MAHGQIGGGAAGWLAKRRSADPERAKSLTLAGMAGAFAGLFSSPMVAMMLVLEIALPVRRRFLEAICSSLVASSVSFGLYFPIAGSVFIGIYEMPSDDSETWHLLAGVGLGVLAAVVAAITFGLVVAATRAFRRMAGPATVKPMIGGVIFGEIGVALPLTIFTGSPLLGTIVENAASIDFEMLLAIFVGKVIGFATSSGSGFIGGPVFPPLFLGGMMGIIVNAAFPDIPLGLAFWCLLAAVPGSVVSAPFTMVLLAALFAQMGALQTAPVVIAVGTACLALAAVQAVRTNRGNATAIPGEGG